MTSETASREGHGGFSPGLGFPRYGFAGLAVIAVAEAMLFAGVRIVGVYFTPFVWTGYIALVDALNVRVRGNSLITSRPREFLAMLPWSVFCWLIFEAYNLRLENWRYIGLPHELVPRLIGFVWAFATIFPAVLETADFFEAVLPDLPGPSWDVRPSLCATFILFGAICLLLPFAVSAGTSGTLFAIVWVGFYFLLDPVNYLLKGGSLLGQLGTGTYARIASLAFAGLTCGVLWEFWNFWAVGKWQYTVPLSFAGPKIFELPVLGYSGFIAFAFECYVMHEVLVTLAPGLRYGPDR